MTQDIIDMARQAGIVFHALGNTPEELEAFAKLVAAKEREACAKVCDSQSEYEWALGGSGEGITASAKCASAIRARGEA